MTGPSDRQWSAQLGSSVTSRKVLTVIPCSACYIPLHMMDGNIAVVACADINSSYGIFSPHDMMCGSFSTCPSRGCWTGRLARSRGDRTI